MVRFVSHKEHQEISMQSSPQQLPKHHQHPTPSPDQQCSEAKSNTCHANLTSWSPSPDQRDANHAVAQISDYIIYIIITLIIQSPLLLVGDGQQERDEVPVNIWTQPTVRLTTYLMRMRTAVVIVKKNLQDQTLGVHFEWLSAVMLSRRLLSTLNEDD